MLDYGAEALADTTAALDDAGIAHAGAGKNQKAAWKPGVVETGDDSTAYLAFSFVVPAGFVAQADRAGLASGRWDVSLIEKAIRKAKRTHDYVIVSFHWGVEYKDNANAEQVKVARRCIDAGADMVLSHHPHVIQGLEIYKKRLIAYSLGDFVFDHYSRKTGESFILNAEMGPERRRRTIKITPTYLDGYGRPAVVRGDEAARDPQAAQEDLEAARHHDRHPRGHCDGEAMTTVAPPSPHSTQRPCAQDHPNRRGPLPGRHVAAPPGRPAGALPRRDGRRGRADA